MICIIDKNDFRFTNTAVTIGKFDGLHIGHKALIKELIRYKQKGAKTVVLRLDIPSDEQSLRSEEERIGILRDLGVDIYIRLSFTDELARMSADRFISDILVERLGACAVVVGEDFRFGYGRTGNIDTLINAGRESGFVTDVVDKLRIEGRIVSSSCIREFLKKGENDKAGKMLG